MDKNWRLKKETLAESLGHIFQVGLYFDVTFEVGEEKYKINAHRSVLSARSEPLAVMLYERWNPLKKGGQIISVPNFNVEPFKMFLKFLYTDRVAFNSKTMDEVLELIHIAHMYQVKRLYNQCKDFLSSKINESNCLLIYKSTKMLDKELSEKAFNYFLGIFNYIVKTAISKSSYLQWDVQIIEDILKSEKFLVPEITLFNALLNWRNVNHMERKNDFRKLVRYIRFPLMDSKTIAEEVDIHQIFSSTDMLELYKYVATKGVHGNVTFNKLPRRFPQQNEAKFKIFQNMSCPSYNGIGPCSPEANQQEFTLVTLHPVKMMAVELFHINTSNYNQLNIEITIAAKSGDAYGVYNNYNANANMKQEEILGKVEYDYKTSEPSNTPLKLWFEKPIEMIPRKEYFIKQYAKVQYIAPLTPQGPQRHQISFHHPQMSYYDKSSLRETVSFGSHNTGKATKQATLEIRKPYNLPEKDFVLIESIILADLVPENLTDDCNIQCPIT